MTDAGPSELLIRQRLAELDRSLPSARRGNISAIHKARVATRRLREALPLVAGGSTGRKLRKTVRRLTRALGLVRELDVARMTLDEIEAEADVPRSGITRLRQVIREERGRLYADMARRIERADLDKLQRRAVAAARRHHERGRARARRSRWLLAARDRAERRAETLVAAIDNAGGIYLPDRLHQVRIAVKKLRYAMEITRELSRSRATAPIRTLQGGQDLLGRMHDLEVLIMRIRALQGSDQAPNLKLSADLDRLVRRLETECRQLHVRYLELKKKLRDVCDHVTAAEGHPNSRPASD
jgi:CHAD domain-containing protein